MVRARLAPVALAAGMGLISGCVGLSNHTFFGKHKDNACTTECGCDAAGGIVSDGPILADGGQVVNPQSIPQGAIIGSPPLATDSQVQPLSPAPRLVPTPQATPTPFRPN